jgi:hypothetical protein
MLRQVCEDRCLAGEKVNTMFGCAQNNDNGDTGGPFANADLLFPRVTWMASSHPIFSSTIVTNISCKLRVVYVGESELKKEIKLASRRDVFAKETRQSIQNGAKSHFHLRNGLLWYKQNRLYVPEGKMRDTLLKECHDGPLAGHGGAKRTTTFLKKS